MPQVDLEAFVCAGGSDRKITCESTFADDPETRPYYYNNNSTASPIDFPPDSYFLSKDAQLEWLTDNAFFDRKDQSHRGNSSVNINSNPNSNPSSQRYSKPSIIGLPKPQNTCLNEAKQRRNIGKTDKNRVFLKRVGSRTKRDLSQLEPSSPKVSCMGRVRSKRERSRRQKSVRPEKPNRVKKPGFLASFRAIFRIGGGCKHASSRGTHTPPSRPRDDIESREPVAPGLGGMTRFASGRRGDLLGGC
ncbi:F27 [Hirschfeldia incana]|nr:F27 [Hirschfeldia incana]